MGICTAQDMKKNVVVMVEGFSGLETPGELGREMVQQRDDGRKKLP